MKKNIRTITSTDENTDPQQEPKRPTSIGTARRSEGVGEEPAEDRESPSSDGTSGAVSPLRINLVLSTQTTAEEDWWDYSVCNF